MLKLNLKLRTKRAYSAFLFLLAFGILSSGPVWAQSTTVVISQVYGGGGGTSTATPAPYLYSQDYVELFNLSSTTQNIGGWSVQYMSTAQTAASATNVVAIPAGTMLAAGKHFLVAGPTGSSTATFTGPALPVAADVTAAVGALSMAGGGGKIFLVSDSTPLANSCTGSDIVDYIGQGSSASCHEGSGPAPAPTALSADVRTDQCVDTDVNSADFSVSTSAVPRDSSSAATVCGGGGGTPTAPSISSAAFNPSTVASGDTTLLTATVVKGTNAINSVKADDSAIGGTTTDVLHDDGLNGDVTAADGIYSYRLSNVTAAVNSYTITITASDGSLTGTKTASLTVQATSAPAAATVALNASASSVVLGNSVTITAVVSGNKGTPTGTVNFLNNGSALGAGTSAGNGTYTYTTSTLPLGAHTITASYSGDGVYPAVPASSTTTTSVTVTPVPVPDFTFSLGNLNLIATENSKVQTTTVNVNMTNGFNSPVSFTCSGTPAGTRCSFSPATLTASGSSTLTIGIDGAALHPHDSPFGKRGGETAFAFLLLSLPLALRRKRFAGTLMAAMLLGVIALGVSGCGADNSTPNGTSSVTVTATGGSVTHTATISLNVQ